MHHSRDRLRRGEPPYGVSQLPMYTIGGVYAGISRAGIPDCLRLAFGQHSPFNPICVLWSLALGKPSLRAVWRTCL